MWDIQSVAVLTIVLLTAVLVVYWLMTKKEDPCSDCCCPLRFKKFPS